MSTDQTVCASNNAPSSPPPSSSSPTHRHPHDDDDDASEPLDQEATAVADRHDAVSTMSPPKAEHTETADSMTRTPPVVTTVEERTSSDEEAEGKTGQGEQEEQHQDPSTFVVSNPFDTLVDEENPSASNARDDSGMSSSVVDTAVAESDAPVEDDDGNRKRITTADEESSPPSLPSHRVSKKKKSARISSFLVASGNITEQDEEADGDESTDAVTEQLPASESIHRRGELSTNPLQQQQQQPSTVTRFKDHFSLSWPSSTIRYRSRAGAARVVETEDFQIILEESPGVDDDDDPSILIRRVNETTLGVKALRGIYLIISTFWTGALLVFAVQVLLLVFVHLAIEFGLTGPDLNRGRSIGALFAIVPLLRGFSHLLALSGAFVVDTYRGHHMIRQVMFARIKRAVVEWIFFLTFLGIPLFVMCCGLLAKSPHWWEITGLLWIVCIMILYLVFVASTLYHEVQSAREVLQKQYPECIDIRSFIMKAIQLRQRKTFSGVETASYVGIGAISGSAQHDPEGNHTFKDSYEKHVSPYSHLTMWSKLQDWGLFEKVESQRIYEIEEAQDIRRYVTSLAWSLDRVFCRAPNERSIIVFRGPGAVTRAQMKSTALCTIVGAGLISLLGLSVLVYLAAGAAGTVLFLIVFGIIGVPRIRTVYRVWKATRKFATVRKEMKLASNGDQPVEFGNDQSLRSVNWSKRQEAEALMRQESEGVQIGKEIYRVSRPTDTFAHILLGMSIVVFLVWPFISLVVSGNLPLAIILLILSSITTTRHLFDAALVLEEAGQLDVLGGASESEAWIKQSRLNTVIEKVTRGQSRKVWRLTLAFLCLVFLAIFLGTVAAGADVSFDEPLKFLPEWVYEQSNDLVYPTCDMGVFFEDSPLTSLADFAFLALVPYRSTGALQEQLDNWFVGMDVRDEVLKVDSYRRIYNLRSQVSFKLVTVPTKDPVTDVVDGEYAYILIRGSISPWDFLADLQIWGGTILFQALRALLPFGQAWNPIIPYLVRAITRIESEAIDELSFYKDTRQFVEQIKKEADEGIYKGVAIIGHSLGGGLAIINGAQEGVKSFALSGVNAMLTRKSLEPAVSPEDLDKFTFNVIPERDLVARFDDPAKNTQDIRCNAERSSLAACHDARRSICEIMYSCGSGNRPALCDCYSRLGYPPPTPMNGTDPAIKIDDVCQHSEL